MIRKDGSLGGVKDGLVDATLQNLTIPIGSVLQGLVQRGSPPPIRSRV
ncbi:protein of unknown function [Candidatus Nitrotoga arctica]|uniref:Uncharacterized protein n=1 Tax=Candidatus Nitrotoga arctica TaxID=453162 RepID=A0ABN8AQE2_9PROT|nr:protein of unknown function [Candidatus Nitrotoga arctica]